MTTESSFRRFGDFKQPVQASQVENGDLFSVFDPTIDNVISFFKTVLIAELSGAWDAVKVTLTNDKLRSASVVQDTYYNEPRRAITREANFEFPLLAVYRKEERFEDITLREKRAIVELVADYILPPLPAEDERRIIAILNAVVKSIATAIEDQGHPAFNNGEAAFFYSDDPRSAVFASMNIKRAKYGRANLGQDGEGVEFPMVQMTFEAVEYDGHLTACGGVGEFESIYGRLHVGGVEGNIENLVEFESPVD